MEKSIYYHCKILAKVIKLYINNKMVAHHNFAEKLQWQISAKIHSLLKKNSACIKFPFVNIIRRVICVKLLKTRPMHQKLKNK